ncbi:class II fructose-1,6-bisphosphate aldolase [Halothermothrix orenii]|uniref:Ketose-bisphosphate aldolase n=1 Tax=Halothermothrix orenii (strain H 168 / OCM 544 / DSM 9562) TaxID=373903 RepID=B8D167_HALOH|nr:class II fructose-1,6-bisphosphate aldolase [Halothermothrix orenii]ACL71019.1 ketose-bisphosphate aldolase [Halothermothrix orenii H 168]
MLVSSKEMLQKAMKEGYAIASFNVHNLETFKGVMEGGIKEKAPVIIQTTPGTLRHVGIRYMVAMARAAQHEYDIPFALHLDHCTDIETIKKCIDLGYTSVMVDGSKLPFEENIAFTKEVVAYARDRGVQVEAELGKIGGQEDDLKVDEREATLTDPDKAVEFVDRTGVDSLAIAIGTAHGMYKGDPEIDYKRLQTIKGKLEVPIVLHGASGLKDDVIEKTVQFGVNKVNIATDLKNAFGAALKTHFREKPEELDPRKYFKTARKAISEVTAHKIRLTGSNNKA